MRNVLSWIAKKIARAHLRCAGFWTAFKEWADRDAPAKGMVEHLPLQKFFSRANWRDFWR
jgi:hypothetical protein